MFPIDAQASSDNPQRLGMAANRIVPALVVVAPERWVPRKRPRILNISQVVLGSIRTRTRGLSAIDSAANQKMVGSDRLYAVAARLGDK